MQRLFFSALIIKAVTGVLEIMTGVAAFVVSKELLVRLVGLVTRRELLQDPGDQFANYIIQLSNQYTSGTQLFVGVYMIVHGAVKIFLIYSLLKRRLWSYPVAIVIFSGFLVYQMYEYLRQPDLILLVVSIIDVVIIVATYFEYRELKKRVQNQETSD